MSFNVNIYRTNDENKKLIKTLTNQMILTGVTKDEVNITSPVIVIDAVSMQGVNDIMNNQNYCYIADFNRYYYITNAVLVRNTLVQLTLKCDVLMSYSASILNLQCVLDKQENVFNLYIPDNDLPVLSYQQIQCKVFPNNLLSNTNHHFILKVAGGG